MQPSFHKLKVAILGSGNIGTDLLMKVLRSPYLECGCFIGRNPESAGMRKARSIGVPASDSGIETLVRDPGCCSLVFDATSAPDHERHAPVLERLGLVAIDLTPAKVGKMCIPAVNLHDCLGFDNINMVTCGGQTSVPLAHAIGQIHDEVEYVEVVSSIASRSAGPATRSNLDEYIETTERCIGLFSGSRRSKAILNLNPAIPEVDMQTTVFAKVKRPDLDRLTELVSDVERRLKRYVPGYQIVVPPMLDRGVIVMMVKVRGAGDYLPPFAGNLDIINCAAIAVAEQYARIRAAEGGDRRCASG